MPAPYRRDDDDSPGHGITVVRIDDEDGEPAASDPSGEDRRFRRIRVPQLRRRHTSPIEEEPDEEDLFDERSSMLQHALAVGWIRTFNAVDCAMHPRLWQEYVLLRQQILEYGHVQGLYTASNSKGGVGKTPLLAYLAALAADIQTGNVSLIIDTNENSGSTAYRLGVSRRKAILLPEFLAYQDRFGRYANLSPRLGRHTETGLRVMPNKEVVSQHNHARRGQMESGLVVARSVADNVFCDPGNGIEHFCNIVPARMADVLLLPALAGDEESIDRIGEVVAHYLEHDDIIRRTIKSSFVVILGASEKKRAEYAARCGYDERQVFTIPYDRHMAQRAANNISVARLRLRTRVALAKLLLAMLRHPRNPYIDELARQSDVSKSVPTESRPVTA